jgi:hypothetical protein
MTFCKKTGTWIGNEEDVNWDLMSEADVASEDHDAPPPAAPTRATLVPTSSATNIAVLREFDVTDALAAEWAESAESAQHELASIAFPTAASAPGSDPDLAMPDAALRHSLLRRVVADCERAGSALRRSRSSSALVITPRNRSPSFGSRAVTSAPPAAALSASAVGLSLSGISETPVSRAEIDDTESDIDDAFEVGDLSARLRAQRSPRRSLTKPGSTANLPVLTFQALQALSNSAALSSPVKRPGLHRRSGSSNGDNESASSAFGPRTSARLPTLAQPTLPMVGESHAVEPTTSAAVLFAASLSERRATTETVQQQRRRGPASASVARVVDPNDLSAYADINAVFAATPLVASSAPQFVSLATAATGYTMSGDFWVPETPYRPRAGELAPQPPSSSSAAVPAAAAAKMLSSAGTATRPVQRSKAAVVATVAARTMSPQFLISRTGAWLKSN